VRSWRRERHAGLGVAAAAETEGPGPAAAGGDGRLTTKSLVDSLTAVSMVDGAACQQLCNRHMELGHWVTGSTGSSNTASTTTPVRTNSKLINTHRVGQKWDHRLVTIILSHLTDLKKMTGRFLGKFVVKWIFKTPAHLAYVATLPCETGAAHLVKH